MRDLTRLLQDLWANEEAATMVEYVLLLGLLAGVLIASFTTFGRHVYNTQDGVVDDVSAALP